EIRKPQNHPAHTRNRHHDIELLVQLLNPNREIIGKFNSIVSGEVARKAVNNPEGREIIAHRPEENMVNNPVDVKSYNESACDDGNNAPDQMPSQFPDVPHKGHVFFFDHKNSV